MDDLTTNTTAAAVTPADETTAAAPAKDATTEEVLGAIDKALEGQKPAESEVNDGKANDPKPEDAPKTYTEKELAALVQKEREQWDADRAESERRAKMTPEEKAAAEEKDKDAKIAALQAELIQGKLKTAARDELSKASMSAELANVLDYSSEDAMQKSLAIVKEAVQAAAKTMVDNRLRGKTPEGLGAKTTEAEAMAAQIRAGIRGE